MTTVTPSPTKILDIIHGYWQSSVLAAAVELGLFEQLSKGPMTARLLAEAANISTRGAQALLDALLSMELVVGSSKGYENSTIATAFLLPGNELYLGAYGPLIQSTMNDWANLSEAARTGRPRPSRASGLTPRYWSDLVSAISPLTLPPARVAASHLGVSNMRRCRVLDVGGGGAGYSIVFLGANPAAISTQLDRPSINRLAENAVTKAGFSNRFRTIDSDMEDYQAPESAYDIIVYSHLAHGMSEKTNRAMFSQFHHALTPGGSLVVADFITDPARLGCPYTLLFSVNMLRDTSDGAIYDESQYAAWSRGAGFTKVEFISVADSPVRLMFATRSRSGNP